MQSFSNSVPDDGLRNELLRAIHGKGAFRYFKDKVHRYGIQDAWYDYRYQAVGAVAADWLRQEGIDFEPDVASASAGETPN